MPAMRRVDGIADVPGEQFDVTCRPDTQINTAKLFAGCGVHHAEPIRGRLVDGMRREIYQFQFKISVREGSGIDRRGKIRHVAPVTSLARPGG